MARTIVAFAALLIVTLALVPSPDKGSKTMDTFEWLPTESAPGNYPIQIIAGNLHYADGTSIYIPDGKVVSNGWGHIGSTHLVGEDLKPVPVRLDVHWFSYTEDTFFEGAFDLPFDRMLELFQQGLDSPTTGEHMTYDRVIVGMAPGGEVSVWLGAEAVALEVATFVAEETATDWSAVLDNPEVTREDYIDIVMEESVSTEARAHLAEHGVPAGLWATFRKQYTWQPEFDGARPVSMWLRTLNGEHEYFDFSEPLNERPLRAAPKTIRLTWQKSSGQQYKTEIEFGEQEVIAAFQKLIGERPDRELVLQLEISEVPPTVDVALAESKYVLPLKKTEVQTYKVR